VEQAQRFHQQAIKVQQITSVLTISDKKIRTLQQKPDCLKQEKKALMQQRLRVDVDSGSNLEYVPFPFGGTATLVPPYTAPEQFQKRISMEDALLKEYEKP